MNKIDADVIGGFPFSDPNCKGCGKELAIENAWMTDGCPCNHVLGINSMNETRWRLLMRLQQLQSFKIESVRAALERVKAESLRIESDREIDAEDETFMFRLWLNREIAALDASGESASQERKEP